MTRSRFIRIIVAAVVLALVGVVSPGGISQAASRSAAATDLERFSRAPSTLPSWPAARTTPAKGAVVYFMSGGDETSAIFGGGIKSAAKALGWYYRVLPYSPSNRGTLNTGIQSAIGAGADAVVFASGTTGELAGAIKLAKARNVALVQMGGSDLSAIGFTAMIDNAEANAAQWGKMLAAAVVADAERYKETANVGLVSSSIFAALSKVNTAFKKSIKSYCAACNVYAIDVPAQDIFSGRAGASVISAMQRNPKINYVEFTLGATSAGVRAALDPVGLGGTRIVGMIPTTAQLKELAKGGSSYWLVVPNELDGWLAVDAIVRARTGGDPTIHNREAEPVWLLGKSSKFDPSKLPELPVSYPAFFGKLWKLR